MQKGRLPLGSRPLVYRFLLALQLAAATHHLSHTDLGVEDLLAQTNGLRSNLDQIVIGDIFDRLLQRKGARRGKQQLFVRACRANRGIKVFWKIRKSAGCRLTVLKCVVVPLTAV